MKLGMIGLGRFGATMVRRLLKNGRERAVHHLQPSVAADLVFSSMAPGIEAATRTPGRKAGTGTAEEGFLHRGPHGARHFVKNRSLSAMRYEFGGHVEKPAS